MFGGKDDKQTDKWQQKYYQSLEQLEQQEKKYSAIEHSLFRGIEKLSHAADGTNPLLDGYLNGLRKSLSTSKTTEPVLKALEDVCQTIDRIGGVSKQKTTGQFSAPDTLALLLKGINFPSGLDNKAKKLANELPKSGADKYPALTETLARIINDAFMSKSGKKEKTDETSLFKRIIGRSVEPVSQVEDINIDLSEVLIQLLEQINLPHEMDGKVQILKGSFSTGVHPENLGTALGSIATLVSEMRTRMQEERRELEKFLKQLTDNLKYLDDYLRRNESEKNDAFESGKELDKKVQAQVRDIESSMKGAQSLDLLKGEIQGQLDQIRLHMVNYLQMEEQRSKRMSEQMQQMNSRMSEMETETNALRERVVHEREQAMIDALTGISNRLAYNERITQEYARWKRYESKLTMAVLDLDFFKKINDTYGHKAGDKVLQTTARILNSNLRETDFLARYGGEEFVILLTETNLDDAFEVVDKLRKKVGESGFHYKDQKVAVTVSCGLAEFKGDDTPEKVFTRADAALYKAKEAGRNCCIKEG